MELHPLELLLSFILTWGVGLAPPLLIRFKFNKEPMGKLAALGTCVGFWFLNVTLFTMLGSRNKFHGALNMVALVTYFILTKKNKVITEADRLVSSAERIKENSDSLTGAAWNGDIAKVESLLEGGADVNEVNGSGQTVLDLARARGDKKLINVLLSYGAKSPDHKAISVVTKRSEPQANYASRLSKLSRWQRLLVVVSISWLFFATITYFLALDGNSWLLRLVPSSAFSWSVDLFAAPNYFGDFPAFPVFNSIGFSTFVVAPVILSWGVGWIAVRVFRWIRAGS